MQSDLLQAVMAFVQAENAYMDMLRMVMRFTNGGGSAPTPAQLFMLRKAKAKRDAAEQAMYSVLSGVLGVESPSSRPDSNGHPEE